MPSNSLLIKLTKTATGEVLKKGVLKNSAIFTEKHLWWSLFFIKLQIFMTATLLKRDAKRGVFLLRNFYETATSELTLHSDCLDLCFWNVSSKTILTQQCYKNTSDFQTRALKTHFGAYAVFTFNSYVFI